MRGSKTLEHIVQSVLEVLRKVSSSDPSQISIDLAATFFGTLLDDPDGAALGSLALDRQSNAVTRPLWQQRTYTIAIAALIAALSPEHAGNGATAMEVDETHQLPSPFIVGLGRVLASAPHTVVRNDAVRAVPWLTRCLAELGGVVTSPSVNASLLAPLLTALIDILDSDVGKREAQGSLIRLVPAVVALTAYRPSPGVREAALRCLQALLKLPYSALHPYRREILTAVAAATDDNKRTVRATAAKCREAWLAT